MNTPYHIPAMLHETVDALSVKPEGTYLDLTFGAGGHAREILKRLGERGRLIGFDQDEDAMRNVPDDGRLTFVRSNFCFLKNFLKYHKVDVVDGILADLGVSFHHFDSMDRGFSFRFDGDLDMRMNRRARLTAAMVLNEYDEERLADVLYLYGELHNSRRIARRVCEVRRVQEIVSVNELLEVLQPFFYKEKERKDLARVFQALRMEVNHEMEALRSMLVQAADVLKPEGRLAVLTYHSLEDRLVKNFMKTGSFEGKLEKDFYGNVICDLRVIKNKATMASAEEVAENPRSRSAKLRVAEKK